MFTKSFLIDLLERVIWTFLQAFGAAFLVDNAADQVELSLRDKLIFSATAGGIAVLKCLLATQVGDSNTAQAIPGSESTYVNEPSK